MRDIIIKSINDEFSGHFKFGLFGLFSFWKRLIKLQYALKSSETGCNQFQFKSPIRTNSLGSRSDIICAKDDKVSFTAEGGQ